VKLVSSICRRCGTKIPDDTTREVCPACLLETGLALLPDEPVAADATCGPVGSIVIPSKFGDFEIARREDGSLWELGRGGMGITYLAVDNVLRRKVALKVIDVPAAARTSHPVRERFLREARAAAALRHPNVAAVYHFGASPDDSHCYYAMELVEGETLEACVRKDGPLNAKLVLEIAIQVTRALLAAAAHGLIHRDLKPGNIMLTRGDADSADLEVKVIDFGLAKAIADAGGEMDLTRGEFVGTPNFASPEQFERGPVDVRSDIYSLGATLWFALTGKTLFGGRDIEEIRSAQKSNALPVEQLKAARVPPSLRSLLRSMLAFEAPARPGIQDLAAQLRRCSALAEIEMAADEKKEIQLEIGHVLFIDIVGYSTLSINEQHAAVDELTQIVRATDQFQKAEAADRLIKIPSGDGMALVFYTNPEAPVRCAMQISRALKEHPRLQIRMGIHSGPVSGVVDVTGRSNLAGAGLNLAQRVMKCGDAGHILISKRVAEDLSEFDEWRPLLHDLGTCEVKHGVQVAVINLWSDDVGNRQLPQKFQTFRKQRTRVRWAEVAAALLLLAGIVAAFVLVSKKSARSTSIAPEKSIAVLPFENLSRDPDNAYFAEGIQEEILTRLAKIADLKVISRTSTQPYQSKPRNLAEIAKQLGVANILEGSVQKAADQVRVTVQLVNAQTDSHLWADTYDRKLTDIFSVESEIAKTIAEQLRAKLTGSEEQALSVKPTNNPEAYDAYLRGLTSYARSAYSHDALSNAIDSYERAVQLDPNFALAWARLSRADAFVYFFPLDATSARRDAARKALENAQKLQPNSPETLLALGYYQYHVLRDYGPAKTTFERVSKMLPASSEVLLALGAIARREGLWDQSIAYFEQALALDPRNVELLMEAAWTHTVLRQFPAALKLYDRALDITPNDPEAIAAKAGIYQAEGNLQEAAKLLSEINAQTPSWPAFRTKITQLRLERNLGEAIRLLQARQTQFHVTSEFDKGVNQFLLAWTQRLAGDTAGAKVTAAQARNTLEPLRKNQPENALFVAALSMANAVLGEKEAALKEAERAIMLLPSIKDRVWGPALEENLALIQMMFGENSRAISTLTRLLQTPCFGWIYGYGRTPHTPALLRLDPVWDPLRADLAFQKLCEEKQAIAPELVTQSAPEKSIAVLPFENLSEEKANAYFADGIQEEILTRLAKIADLKVISRTSTQKYKSSPDNLREIAQQLGVANILEGSVQKVANQVRVNVQLVNAQTDSHLWAETYDRKLTDIFGVESEIAKKIAESLQANLSPSESHVLASVGTHDAEAYDLFLRGQYEFHRADISRAAEAYDRAEAFYRQALARDPKFAEAAAGLARSRLLRHWLVSPLTATQLEEVKSIIDRALALAPNSPEAHLALGFFFYWGHRQYQMALAEFNRALELQPNNASALVGRGAIYRRRGEWERSLADFQRAEELNPRDTSIQESVGSTYLALRLWKDSERAALRSLAIDPHHAVAAMVLLVSRLNATGDVDSARRTLDGFPEAIRPLNLIGRGATAFSDVATIIGNWVYLDVIERRFTDAFQDFEKEVGNDDRAHPRQLTGRVALRLLAGETEAAKSAGKQALPLLEAELREQPDDTFAMTGLSWVYLALGRNADALRLSKQAADLIPIEKDAMAGPIFQNGLAEIEARAGAPEEAIKRLRRLLSIPAGHAASIARLKIDPVWDPIRNRPDFQQLLSGPEQIGPNK
jgi:TolB-like protein/serine/threonine protein kinase/Tfp pilus assembly protein PilF